MFMTMEKNVMIKEATRVANEIFKDKTFWNKILEVEQFDMTTLDTQSIVNILKASIEEGIITKLYKPFWRWSKAMAKFEANHPDSIFLSSRRLIRHSDWDINIASLVGSKYHESVHLSDNLCEWANFGHGNNSPIGKEKTAPYLIGDIAAEYALNILREEREMEENGCY